MCVQEHFNSVSRKFQGCLRKIQRYFKEIFKKFQHVSIGIQECFKEVSMCFMEFSMVFQECFKCVSRLLQDQNKEILGLITVVELNRLNGRMNLDFPVQSIISF